MLGQLFLKECKQTARSLIYWLIVLVLIFDFAAWRYGDPPETRTRAGGLWESEKQRPGIDYGEYAGAVDGRVLAGELYDLSHWLL